MGENLNHHTTIFKISSFQQKNYKACIETRKYGPDEWIKKMYSAIKEKEILPLAATNWINLVGTMPSEMNQTQKDKYCITSLICGISKSLTHKSRMKQQLSDIRGWEK